MYSFWDWSIKLSMLDFPGSFSPGWSSRAWWPWKAFIEDSGSMRWKDPRCLNQQVKENDLLIRMICSGVSVSKFLSVLSYHIFWDLFELVKNYLIHLSKRIANIYWTLSVKQNLEIYPAITDDRIVIGSQTLLTFNVHQLKHTSCNLERECTVFRRKDWE